VLIQKLFLFKNIYFSFCSLKTWENISIKKGMETKNNQQSHESICRSIEEYIEKKELDQFASLQQLSADYRKMTETLEKIVFNLKARQISSSGITKAYEN
jgi:hypothetical protein